VVDNGIRVDEPVRNSAFDLVRPSFWRRQREVHDDLGDARMEVTDGLPKPGVAQREKCYEVE